MGSKVSTSQAHTAAPWFVVDKHEYYPKLGKNVVASFDGYEIHTENHLGDNEADVRLIAAAPELLEACKMAFEQKDASAHGQRTPHNDIDLLNTLRAAIAKAEGRA